MAPPAMRIEKPDATFKSLSALLGSSAASARSHLSLIGNTTLSGSITHYLATLPTDEASKFARQLVTSEVIWSESEQEGDQQAFIDPSTASSGSTPSNSPKNDASSSKLLPRAQLLFEATARAVLGRIQVIVHKHKGELGWNAQRLLVSWIRALNDAVHVDLDSVPKSCRPLPISSFALQTGLVAGLQAARAQRKQQESSNPSISGITNSNALSTRYALRRAEEEWCTTLAECLHILTNDGQKDEVELKKGEEEDIWEAEFRKISIESGMEKIQKRDLRNDPQTVLLFLATQVSPYIPAKKLSILPPNGVISILSKTMLDLFDHSDIFQSLREDVQQDTNGTLILRPSSGTSLRAQLLNDHPLFPLFGPLSRLLSLAFSNVIRTTSPAQVQEILLGLSPDTFSVPLVRMYTIATEWQAKWLGSRLAGAKESEIAPSSKQQTKILWNIFKTLLFSYTMIFDALMEAIVDVCPTPTDTRPITANVSESDPNSQQRWLAMTESNIPNTYLQIVHTILLTYSKLSWIISTFGTGGFDAYRRVFYEALEVLSRDGRSSVALTVELIPSPLTAFQINPARRAQATFFFDVIEQLMVQLPDDLIVDQILPACRPYLDDRTYQEAFESAHSVILSIYSTGKECLLEFTPYYSQLLLTSFPVNLSVEQLTLAYSTVLDAVSGRSDTLAWHTLELLWNSIEKEKVLYSYGQTRKDAKTLSITTSTVQDSDEKEETLSKLESELCDVYVAQIANVNLVLLKSILDRVKRLIMQRTRGSEERLHLCQKTFASLAGLDASTREEGVRWWLAERERFGV